METAPKISIIMPTYNRAHLIGETVDSIRNQTFTNWELLIMDDGSDDNTEKIIEQYNDDRIQFYKGGRTGAVSKLKNTAIKIARGELIAFIDSDDLWHSTKLEKQLAAMEQYPEAGFCLTGGYTFINKNEPVGYLYKQRDGLRYGNFMLAMFRSQLSGYTQALLFRKDCLHVSGYFDETKLFSDPDFILSLTCHFKGIVLYEPLFFRRLHELSDSDENWEERYGEWVDVIQSYHARKLIPALEVRKSLFKLYINYGEKCLRINQRGKAIKNFVRAWTNKPFSIIPVRKTAKAVLSFLK
ncbi:MAG: glycosyltransferase family 2 protein [Chitinophagaceae bacterium]|nr:glycosyltransferase family 2 protein [Chitinophagaceae bacterium]